MGHLLYYLFTYSLNSHLPGTHCVVGITLGTEDRTVKEGDAVSLVMELIVYLGMYLGLFFKKNWVFRRTDCGHVQLEFNGYVLVSFYVLGILNTEMRK